MQVNKAPVSRVLLGFLFLSRQVELLGIKIIELFLHNVPPV